jgi:tRNA A37 threonylcarbamoyltransferase TsaD
MGHQISGTKELARKVARENRNNVKEAKVDQSTLWSPSQMTIDRFVLHIMHKAAKAAAAEFMFVGCGVAANRIQCGNITKA